MNYREPRYRCRFCLDSGLATVWQTNYVRFFRDTYVENGYAVPADWKQTEEFKQSGVRGRETAACPCSCERGRPTREQAGREKRVAFDEDRHCAYYNGDVAKLTAWLEDHSQRFNEFDQFNESGAF